MSNYRYRTRPCSCGCGDLVTTKRLIPEGRPAYLNDEHKRSARTAREREERKNTRFGYVAARADDPYLVSPELDPWHQRRLRKAGTGGESAFEGVSQEIWRCYQDEIHGNVDAARHTWRQVMPPLLTIRRKEGESLRKFQSRLATQLRWPEPSGRAGFATSYLTAVLTPVVVPQPWAERTSVERELAAA